MTTFHPAIKELPIAEIAVTDRLRPVGEDQVAALIELMEECKRSPRPIDVFSLG